MNAKRLVLDLDYLPLEQLLELIEPASAQRCKSILLDNRVAFERTPGSTHNHQAWRGGYLDHIIECLNYARHSYALDSALGRLMPFSLSDALLILFLHDLEKPWRIDQNSLANKAQYQTKADFKRLRMELLARYDVTLTCDQLNALAYVEGEGNDYSSAKRVMNELAAFCHRVDVWSARQAHQYPLAKDDPWTGAQRFRG